MRRILGVLIGAALALSACAANEPGEPIFATADTTCESAVLTNDDGDEQALATAVDCLFREIEAGSPVTVDLNIASVEGDPIYHRYAYDGETVLIVEDNRADEFGTPVIRAQECQRLVRTDWVPVGEDCAGIDHDGFPEAVRE